VRAPPQRGESGVARVGDARQLEVTEGVLTWGERSTWYRVTGALDGARPPVVAVHGGPGATHDYLLAMADLAGDGRAVVHYDQVGNGRSSRHPDADPASWTVELFVEELARLVRHLGIDRSFHLVGQSWGGMLGPEFALAHPEGLRSLTICDSPASMELWLKAANRLRADLPDDVQATLLRHEAAGTTSDPEYTAAMQVFYDRHVCRVLPNPPEVAASFAAMAAEPTVYHTMNGPSEFHVIGSLVGWSVIDRLPQLRVPTLVVAGAYDEAQPETWQPFLEHLPDVRSHVFPESSHMPHVEEPQAFLDVLGDFLRAHD
jgi:L-proline amide hydrolase